MLLTSYILPVWGSTGGVTNVGGFTTSAEHFTGVREWVELDSTGKLLKGFLAHDLLKLMTVYAPGASSGHIIFRELATRDGRRSFLLTAPDDLAEKIQRITLFLQPKSHLLELYEQNEGVWTKRMPQPLRVAALHDAEDPPQDLVAFSLEKPGFFWILESSSLPLPRSSFVPQDSSAKSLMGGSILWGFSALAASILLLVIGWMISCRIHAFDQIPRS
ncbi:MAG: hypothetical protein R3B95_15975 [Nitrospirales bacterium]|nr:hypothetical protein [Nitrospirales bacterium]